MKTGKTNKRQMIEGAELVLKNNFTLVELVMQKGSLYKLT
jgi:hypothetical protein